MRIHLPYDSLSTYSRVKLVITLAILLLLPLSFYFSFELGYAILPPNSAIWLTYVHYFHTSGWSHHLAHCGISFEVRGLIVTKQGNRHSRVKRIVDFYLFEFDLLDYSDTNNNKSNIFRRILILYWHIGINFN